MTYQAQTSTFSYLKSIRVHFVPFEIARAGGGTQSCLTQTMKFATRSKTLRCRIIRPLGNLNYKQANPQSVPSLRASTHLGAPGEYRSTPYIEYCVSCSGIVLNRHVFVYEHTMIPLKQIDVIPTTSSN